MTTLSDSVIKVVEKTAELEKGASDLSEVMGRIFDRAKNIARENPELVGAGTGALAGGLIGHATDTGLKGTLLGAGAGAGLGAAVGNIAASNIGEDDRLKAPENAPIVDFGEAALLPAKLVKGPVIAAARHPFVATGLLAGELAAANALKRRALADPTLRLGQYFTDRAKRIDSMDPKELNKWWRVLLSQFTGGNRRVVDNVPYGRDLGENIGKAFSWASRGGPLPAITNSAAGQKVIKAVPGASAAKAGAASGRAYLARLVTEALKRARL